MSMEITEAAHLISPGVQNSAKDTIWADLGSGDGIFTKALATLLNDGSKIYAVDKEPQRIKFPNRQNVEIEFLELDFVREILPVSNLDGILMANALHYVKDKDEWIRKIISHLAAGGQMVIVEYDTEKQNAWVPYPIPFHRLSELLSDAGFRSIKKIGERRSIFNAGKMYACSATHNA